MNNAIKFATLSLMLIAVLPMSGVAAQKKKKAASVTCPVCHMALSTKKTKADPVAMHLKPGGKIYYCCAQCKMSPKLLVNPKTNKVTKPSK